LFATLALIHVSQQAKGAGPSRGSRELPGSSPNAIAPLGLHSPRSLSLSGSSAGSVITDTQIEGDSRALQLGTRVKRAAGSTPLQNHFVLFELCLGIE
tara:strand:- start:385 stop:678 length:294 start_codon:yes stop_codon:yes gene_type:complete